MQLASIDIGSNAVRLLVAEACKVNNGDTFLKKEKMYRVPLRLGADAFGLGYISDSTAKKLIKTMQAFKNIMDVYGVSVYRACATSALRESANAHKIVALVRREAGLEIELISGDEEAEVVLNGQLTDNSWLDTRFSHLHMDVGGGSTELSLRQQTHTLCAHSFQIGTVRLFEKKVIAQEWDVMGQWLTEYVTPKLPLAIIGAGGNINSIFKRSDNHDGEPLFYNYIKHQRQLLSQLTIEDRMRMHDMNRDRAEVIVHALDIFLYVMEKTQIKQVFVPKIGLVDGIMMKLYEHNKIKLK